MGAWSTGLYGSDFASDLQTTIKAVARLPYEASQLVDILRDSVGPVASDVSDEDHTNFWFVTADQFHKRGINARIVFETALRLMDEGTDLEMLRSLGMSKSELNKRLKVLAALREKIQSPLPKKKRSTLSKPEPFLMSPGEILIYPLSRSGAPRNPYMPSAIDDWKMGKWGAAVALRMGRAFGFLAWYQMIKLCNSQPARPTPTAEQLADPELSWRVTYPGSCPSNRFKRIQLTSVGSLSLNEKCVNALLAKSDLGADKIDDYAIEDICISNELDVNTSKRQPSIRGIRSITR